MPINAPCNDRSEQRANAQLISAAPDLYQALKDLLTYDVERSPFLWPKAKISGLNALRKAERNT